MNKIKYFKIYGERNSGTNYLYNLIRYNTDLKYLGHHWDSVFGWKHDIIDSEDILNCDYEDIRKHTLFLHIYKNPYSWAISMYNKPHHMKKMIEDDKGFMQFINSNWNEAKYFHSNNESIETIDIKLKNYRNIFDLRYQKLKSHINVARIVENSYQISYEALLKNPSKIISQIKKDFNLDNNNKFKDVNFRCDPIPRPNLPYKDIHNYYLNEDWKKELPENVIKKINDNLNIKFENNLGYNILKK